jgi:hypothetical protein
MLAVVHQDAVNSATSCNAVANQDIRPATGGPPMKILMLAILLVMIAGVLSLTVVGGGSKQVAKGQPLLASSSRLMGPR